MTELQEKSIIQDYISGITKSKIARKYHVADHVISSIVKGLPSQK